MDYIARHTLGVKWGNRWRSLEICSKFALCLCAHCYALCVMSVYSQTANHLGSFKAQIFQPWCKSQLIHYPWAACNIDDLDIIIVNFPVNLKNFKIFRISVFKENFFIFWELICLGWFINIFSNWKCDLNGHSYTWRIKQYKNRKIRIPS